VIYGDGDRVVPPAQGPLLAASIPGAELLRFAGAGHLPHWEDYPRFRAAIDVWMRRTADL
jgi:pimeloyl-ACP methyl ester carboxylesterase